MNNYICENGLMHDKPCKDGKPSSNNGWIYTSYLYAISPRHRREHKEFLEDCIFKKDKNYDFTIQRLPWKATPVCSRDELIGIAYIFKDNFQYGLMLNKDLSWYRKDKIKHQGLLKAMKSFWRIRKEHRNYVWQQKVYECYPYAFRLPPTDRYYFKKITGYGGRVTLLETLHFYLENFTTAMSKNNSAKNICWLKLHALKSKHLIKMFNYKKQFLEYFGSEHYINSVIQKGDINGR